MGVSDVFHLPGSSASTGIASTRLKAHQIVFDNLQLKAFERGASTTPIFGESKSQRKDLRR